MEKYLVVNILAENTNENIRKFSKLAKSSKCNVIDCHFKVMGQYLSAIFLFSGSWKDITKMENILTKLENECNIIIQKKRAEIEKLQADYMPYVIDIVGPGHANIMYDITDFIINSNLLIKKISTSTYEASWELCFPSDIKMFALHMIVHIPSNSSIATIRGEFTEFCDQFNLDTIMEPLK